MFVSLGWFAAGAVVATGARSLTPAQISKVEGWCNKTNPSYPIEVWWGNPPAFYCTDDIASPSKSIPFSMAAACASAGLPPPDSKVLAAWRNPTFVVGVPCATTGTPTTTSPKPPCGAQNGTLHRALSSAEAVAAVTSSCKLSISVAPQKLSAGMRLQGGVGFQDKNEVCVSGCVVLTVHVTDSNSGKPVNGAKVTASVVPIERGLPPYPKGEKPGGGYLCPFGSHRCGSPNNGLVTNKSGKVALVYWVPGLWSAETPALTVSASAHVCSQSGCSMATGRLRQPIAVSARLVYRSDFQLPVEQRRIWETWASPIDLGTWAAQSTWVSGLQDFAKAWSFVTTVFLPEEALFLDLFENVHRAHSVLERFDALDAKDKLRLGLLGLFLEDFKIFPGGLGATSDGTSAKITEAFVDQLVGNHGDKSTGGLLYDFARALVFDDKSHSALHPQQVTLVVYEISYCAKDAEFCDPSQPHAHNLLYFELGATTFPYAGFVTPYAPSTWAEGQKNLTG